VGSFYAEAVTDQHEAAGAASGDNTPPATVMDYIRWDGTTWRRLSGSPERMSTLRITVVAALPFATAALFVLTACKADLIHRFEVYTGPTPDSVALVDERVIVRTVWSGDSYLIFMVERVRFAEAGDWHNVDRVVKLETPADTRAAIAQMGLRKGDRLRISTTYLGTASAGQSLGVPNWPGHNAWHYPVGRHLLESVAQEP
jgi:hypothetical protein